MCNKKPKIPTPAAPASAPTGNNNTPNVIQNASGVDNQAKGKRRLTINPNSIGTGVNI